MVALETTVISHGLPYPENLNLAKEVETEIRSLGAVPVTIGMIDGRICAGLNDAQLNRLALGGQASKDGAKNEDRIAQNYPGENERLLKISSRDLGPAAARHFTGGTTVAGTLAAAYPIGIKIFSTGGIGGVHRNAPDDVSADLIELSRVPLVVVCAGAKAILDIPATLEKLETYGVPVVGYQTDEFPAFYSRSSGYPTSARADSPEEVARIAHAHWEIGLKSAVLVVVPPPENAAISNERVEQAIQQALQEARRKDIRGQEVTPFLLDKVSELTKGDSLRANLALLRNNARTAASISRYLYPSRMQYV
jgi:pseudouridine-5'-phosphate glycosidase